VAKETGDEADSCRQCALLHHDLCNTSPCFPTEFGSSPEYTHPSGKDVYFVKDNSNVL